MDLTQLANLGEFIGGIAVLATLVYLALQVRQNNTWQMRQGFKDAVSNLKDSLIRLGENANLWNRGCESFESLDKDDRLRFHCVIAERYGAFELFYDYHKSRNVKVEAIHGINRWMREDFSEPGVREWWEVRGRDTYSSDFAAVVDEVVSAAR